MFLLKELFKCFTTTTKTKIGFILPDIPLPYNKAMASTRLRVYDIINLFINDNNFFLEIYKPWKKYDVVIFQKKFDKKALLLAKKLKSVNSKIILDINVNYYDKSFLDEKLLYQHDDILNFTKISDAILTTTSYIQQYAQKIFPQKKIFVIPEIITDNFFSTTKKTEHQPLRLLYTGYALKAKEILHIREELLKLHTQHSFEILFICEKNPHIKINNIKISFVKYNQQIIPEQLREGDIFIAPRDISNPYNLGHSFTKIGYPMSIGLPIIASAVPSYLNSPALICQNKDDWEKNLKKILTNKQLRINLKKKGIQHCKDNISKIPIKSKYLKFLNSLS